MMQKK